MSDVVFFYPRTDYLERGGLSVHPPLSVLYPASLLKDRGHSVRIIDQRVEPGWQRELATVLRSNPLCLGISAMTGRQIHWALAAASFARRHAPDVPLVWGGVHPSLVPRQTVSSPLVDYVVAGEGELAMAGLADRLAGGDREDLPAGIVTENSDGNAMAETPDLDALPFPSYELLHLSRYNRRKVLGETSFPLLTSRGCSHRCAFCYNGAYHQRRWRAESPDRTVEHLQIIATAVGPVTLDVQDDNFFVSNSRVERLCRLILRSGLKTTFKVTCRVEYVLDWDQAFLELLARTGVTQLFIGVESGSDRVLAVLAKGHTVADAVRCNQRLARFGIAPRYSFMAGFPDERPDEVRATVSLMIRLLEDNPAASCTFLQRYTPYPGTDLASECQSHGWTPPTSLEGWAKHSWYRFGAPWLTSRLSRWLGRLSVTTMLIQPRSGRDVGFPGAASALVSAYSRSARARLAAGRTLSAPEVLVLRKVLGL